MSNIVAYSVAEITSYIKQILDANTPLNDIWIRGEISNFKSHYSGHMYLTLKDEKAVIKSVMFKNANMKLSFKPNDGMKVLVRGRVSVFEGAGQYQLYIEEMIPDGIGSLFAAYEQLKNKLDEEGLFKQEYKQKLPLFPKVIGVVTATTGAAVRDIINVLQRRYPLARVRIYPSLVQGEGASANICEAIEFFNKNNAADILIVGRGGGSIEDLWAFNEEATARAIFSSKIPIISAVGHETDFTIADFVADKRAPTPSAAAEISVPSLSELSANITAYKRSMLLAINGRISIYKNRVSSIADKNVIKNPKRFVDDKRIVLDDILVKLINAKKVQNAKGKERYLILAGKLDALSPLSVLKRGYGIAKDEKGDVIKSVAMLEKDKHFELVLQDGSKKCQVL